MSDSFPPSTDELIETFDELDDWAERYEYIVELGRELPPMDTALQTEENKVHGCQSLVWMVARFDESPQRYIELIADSDSLIVKGLIVILLSVFSGVPADQVVQKEIEPLFVQLGLTQHLSPNRRNGLFSMVARVRELAAQRLQVKR